MKKILLILAGTLAVACISLFSLAYLQLNSMINVHLSSATGSPKDYHLPFTTVQFPSTGNTTITGWYIKATRPKAVIILVHGYSNPGGKATMLGHSEYLYKAGYSSLVIDLGGAGESTRQKITLGILESSDIAAAFKFLKEQPENKQTPVGLLGYSMGAASVLTAAGKYQVGQFVIELDGYQSINDLLRVEVTKRGLPAPLVLPFMQGSAAILLGPDNNQYAPQNYVSNIRVPLLILHGIYDTAVPLGQGKLLFSRANEPKKMVELRTTHNIFGEDPKGVENAVLQFLTTLQ